MEIIFSRHAKRRMRLFKIDEKDVEETIGAYWREGLSGRQEVVNNGLSEKYGFPLKVVFFQESDKIHVVTAYPLKRGRPP